MPMWILAVHPVAIIIFFIAVFLSLAIGNIVIGNTSTLATFPDDSCKWFHGFSSFHKVEWRS